MVYCDFVLIDGHLSIDVYSIFFVKDLRDEYKKKVIHFQNKPQQKLNKTQLL